MYSKLEMESQVRAAVVEEPGKLAMWDIPAPRPGPYHALVRMEVAAICNSTDTKIKDGHFPGFDTYPTTLGHEGVGTVVEIGAKVRSYKVGDRVLNPCTMQTGVEGLASGWGTMAAFALAGDFAAMQADGVCDPHHGFDSAFETQKVIPADIPSRQAVLMATWREVLSSFSDFGFAPGSSLLVIGGGPVGLSFVALAKIAGMSPVCITSRSQWKLDKAISLGADYALSADAALVERARQLRPGGFDFVVDAVGSPAVMNQALRLIGFNGTVCVYGTVPEKSVTLTKEQAPYNWKLIMHQWPDYAREAGAHEPICQLIRAGKLSAESFVTHELAFDEIEEGLDLIRRNEATKVLLWF
jgi:2-desacetyl-2-hydroxyethyl bacteriochlorophyllide A dehydrogenase